MISNCTFIRLVLGTTILLGINLVVTEHAYENWNENGDTAREFFSARTSSSSSSSNKFLMRIPPINFYKSTSNAIIVVSKFYKFLRELSAALGTPYVLVDWAIPVLWLAVALVFVPDFTQLHQYPFYPNGGGPGNDPLAAFPPIP